MAHLPQQLPTNQGSIMSPESTTYKEYYEVLLEARKSLSTKEPDIDALIPIYEEATRGYKGCIERLDQIDAALSYAQNPIE